MLFRSTNYIYLHVQGEPLLHSKFNDILNICDEFKMNVHITTNATLLNKYHDILSHSSIRKISLSMHAYDELDFDLDDFLCEIFSLFNKLGSNQYIELRFWNRNNLNSNSKYIIEKIKTTYELSITKKPNSYKIIDNVYLHFDDQFTWPNDADNANDIGSCNGVKSMICILSNGDVTPCCLDQNCRIKLGNIFQNNLDDILNTKKYKTMIKGLNQNKLVEELCRQCSYRKRFE